MYFLTHPVYAIYLFCQLIKKIWHPNTNFLAVNGSNVTLKGDGDKYVLVLEVMAGTRVNGKRKKGLTET